MAVTFTGELVYASCAGQRIHLGPGDPHHSSPDYYEGIIDAYPDSTDGEAHGPCFDLTLYATKFHTHLKSNNLTILTFG